MLTVVETARLLRVSAITVRRYIADGRLAAVRIGRNVRIDRSAVETLVGGDASGAPEIAERTEITYSPRETPTGQIKDTVMELPRTGYGARQARPIPEAADWKVFSFEDPYWQLVGMFKAAGPEAVSENVHKYLADAYLPKDE